MASLLSQRDTYGEQLHCLTGTLHFVRHLKPGREIWSLSGLSTSNEEYILWDCAYTVSQNVLLLFMKQTIPKSL